LTLWEPPDGKLSGATISREDTAGLGIPVSLGDLRVLVVHDWIVSWGGAERCLEEILRLVPNADLVTGFVATHLRDRNEVTRAAAETWMSRVPGARRRHRWFLPIQGLAFATLKTAQYDLVISSSHALCKAVRARAGVPHICYCYSPPRYLWDMNASYRRSASTAQRAALSLGTLPLQWFDRGSARGVDRFVCISHHIATRVQRCYGRRADVVYPPVSAKPVADLSAPRGDYLLSLGRLVEYKRIDLAIQAAELLGVDLVVAGDGPDRRRLERLAGSRTHLVGEVSETAAGRLLSGCGAFVFCAEEDFGIAPVEANAHGAPVIAYRAGGVCETMREGETAVFFDRPDVESLAAAIRTAREIDWDPVRLAENADRFRPQRFRNEFGRIVATVLSRATCSGRSLTGG
jgi:glycosyltransferase involved in cell wall biosynthesis